MKSREPLSRKSIAEIVTTFRDLADMHKRRVEECSDFEGQFHHGCYRAYSEAAHVLYTDYLVIINDK